MKIFKAGCTPHSCLALIFSIVAALLSASDSSASTCAAGPRLEPGERAIHLICSGAAVFVATVKTVSDGTIKKEYPCPGARKRKKGALGGTCMSWSPNGNYVHFEVEEVFKGQIDKDVWVQFEDDMHAPSPGETWVVEAYGTTRREPRQWKHVRLATNRCLGSTKNLEHDLVAELREARDELKHGRRECKASWYPSDAYKKAKPKKTTRR